jgi:hypothetical protein
MCPECALNVYRDKLNGFNPITGVPYEGLPVRSDPPRGMKVLPDRPIIPEKVRLLRGNVHAKMIVVTWCFIKYGCVPVSFKSRAEVLFWH